MFKTKDQFLFLTAAVVVILSAFVIIGRRLSQPRVVEAAQDLGALMEELDGTADDGGESEFRTLEKESLSL